MSCIPIISGALELYTAPVGETFPDVDAAPAGNWELVGQAGTDHYDEEGVEVEFSKSYNEFRGARSGYAVCLFGPTEVNGMVRLTLADSRLEALRLMFNQNTVTVDAGPPAIKHMSLDVSGAVQDLALLARGSGSSPDFDGGNMQIECNRVVEAGTPTAQFHKGGPVLWSVEFRILVDTSGGFPGTVGRIVSQTA